METRSTGEVARELSRETGHELTEKRINALLRRTPSIRPPLVGGRRAWRAGDVAELKKMLVASAERTTAQPNSPAA